MYRTLRLVTLFLILTTASTLLCWQVMTNDQRREFLTSIGVAGSVEKATLPTVHDPTVRDPAAATTEPREPVSQQPTTAYGHPESLCRDWSRPTTEVDRAPIYRWTDANGRLRFGDRPPPGVPAERMNERLPAPEQFARPSFVDRGTRFGPQLSSVYPADAAAVGRVLRTALGLPVRQIDVKLTLAPAGQALVGEGFSGGHLVGLYIHGQREIAVQEQASLASTRVVARHETSHAMLAALYGPTPPWINEGLAELAGALEQAGQMRSIQVNLGHAQRLRFLATQYEAGSLARLLTMDAPTWKSLPLTQTYAPAWALAHLLMESDAGRGVLKAVLAAQLETPCRAIDSVRIIDRYWPGGARALEQAWIARMRSGSWQALNF